MSIPIGAVPVPDVVTRIAAGRQVYPAWANEIGGLTFHIGDGAGREFVKVAPPHPEVDLRREALKLRWASSYMTVPRWADLAVAAWSLGYDYGGDWRTEFFAAYGAAPDDERLDYYLTLWNAGDISSR